jgi:hypothetical protein
MAVARSVLVSFACAALVLGAVVVPSKTLADSTGVPVVDGQWTGTFQTTYWDQTQDGFIKPKKKFKSDVVVDIDQEDTDEITMTITFEDELFPVSAGAAVQQLVLEGFTGNYHFNLAMDGGPWVTLSGSSNKSAKNLKLTGVAASGDYTHEIKLSLKRSDPK